MSNVETINSDHITLEEIVKQNYIFDIPIYQRLYVWKEEQVKILLDDMYTAYQEEKDIFYLGGVLVVENEQKNGFDLIDGQQRFTTLWMMSIVFGNDLKNFMVQKEDKKSFNRVNFSIRESIKTFFESYIIDNIVVDGSTENIINALSVMESFKSAISDEDIIEFSTFIYKNINLLFTSVPQKTDLNKLFEIINNRGVQLQHHEILKAKLLNILPSDERLKYSYLWDACSHMDNYVEKNIRDIANIKISNLFENDKYEKGNEKLSKSHKVLEAITTVVKDEFKPLSLINILSNNDEYEEKKDTSIIEEEYESDNKVRSIITFSMLLQHILRIHLLKYYNDIEDDIPKILDKELLSLFDKYYFYEEIDSDDVRAFIELLWEVRYLFDKYVIKWIETEEGEEHLINKLYKSKNKKYYTLTRRKPDSNDGCSLLQSMLYHSQQLTTHYWLTPYLNYLLEYKGKNNYEYLRHLDNYLLSGEQEDSLIKRTHKFLVNPYTTTKIDYKILNEPEGVSFAHYWFYKLEFILWYLLKDKNDKRWKEFKFTAKNSVEHISPQTPKEEDSNVVENIDILNSFGNLSLVSRSINSEYSNLPYNEKRQRFKNKNVNEIDSLKMEIIYSNKNWNDKLAIKHQKEMLSFMEQYFNENISFLDSK